VVLSETDLLGGGSAREETLSRRGRLHVIVDATIQALIGLAINTMYLFIFELKRPMLWYPSKTFKKQNLFHVLDRCSSAACVVGSAMSVLGARKASIVDLVGGVFAVVNLLYVSIALYVFARDTKLKSLAGKKPDSARDVGRRYC